MPKLDILLIEINKLCVGFGEIDVPGQVYDQMLDQAKEIAAREEE